MVISFTYPTSTDCKSATTTASRFAAKRPICSGSLIFEENFENWNKLMLMTGGVRTLQIKNNPIFPQKFIFYFSMNRIMNFNGTFQKNQIFLRKTVNCTSNQH